MLLNPFFLMTMHFQIVEFIAVLLKAGNQAAEEELVNSGTIKRVLDLFFEWVTSAPISSNLDKAQKVYAFYIYWC